MKNFKEYLAESQRVYEYRIKIAGDMPADFVGQLKDKLSQFDVIKFADVKTTPVQAKLPDFPQFSNDRVNSMDVTFRYPAIEPQIRQLAQMLGMDPNRVRMLTAPYEDSMAKEYEDIEEQNKDLLTDTDYPAPDAEQKALSKDYATGPYDHAVLKNAYRSEFTVAGGKTPKATTTNDLPMGKQSPMSTVKRPPRPSTGKNPRG
ncbi:hypothetical protein UFOVP328_280 [uncultured Caudovirales phage]|uniref:Uncharacterized protein n=1 Tax=uncultured Caudovirales phage TaxID=2100421 RepID=A0A6J5LYD9_9CAUD|nr:hypothetical protein UFOVP328_280 [uncultured Caudovirales phage]